MFNLPGQREAPDHSEARADVVDLLLDCHQRIRYFADLGRRLGELEGLSAEDVRTGAFRVRRYFGEALPLHVADEEESVLPRLRGREAALDEALARMSREHGDHEPLLATLLETCRELEAAPERHEELRGPLLETVTALERDFAAHLEQEEAIILPAIRRLLPADEREAMVAELRARRTQQWQG